MRQLPRDPHLGEEPVVPHRIRRKSPRKEFESDRLPQLQIIGSIDFPHTAAAKQSDDAIPVRCRA